jgi:transposase, IS4 family
VDGEELTVEAQERHRYFRLAGLHVASLLEALMVFSSDAALLLRTGPRDPALRKARTRFIKADYTAERFSWSLDEAAIAAAELFDGKLALLTNAPDLTPVEAVRRYKSLADIERGFRVLKSDIEIPPVHQRLPDRIRAHALIGFLALVLYRVMRMRLKAKGSNASPKAALELLARIQRHHTKIGERSMDGISTTTPEQLELFDTLNLPQPT